MTMTKSISTGWNNAVSFIDFQDSTMHYQSFHVSFMVLHPLQVPDGFHTPESHKKTPTNWLSELIATASSTPYGQGALSSGSPSLIKPRQGRRCPLGKCSSSEKEGPPRHSEFRNPVSSCIPPVHPAFRALRPTEYALELRLSRHVGVSRSTR